jgi:ubiquinone/menaquinone biosynthesis C-methylase UbiE
MTTYSPKRYWPGLAERYAHADRDGFSPVMHPSAPPWFNRMIDAVQFRAIRRALRIAAVSPGTRILDVGCGTGRWVRRYEQLGLRTTGVDAALPMLRLARERGTATPLSAGDARLLPFAPETFDCVSDITVVQHIPTSEQPEALRELTRVLKPGGRMILMELIRGKGEHVFPRDPADWIQQVASCGGKLISWFAEEYLVFDRLFVRAAQMAGGKGTSARPEPFSAQSLSRRSSLVRGLYWGIRRLSVPISTWTDPLVERIVPANLATHGVFIFRK